MTPKKPPRAGIDGQWIVLLCTILYFSIVITRVYSAGWERGWLAVRVAAMEPTFADMRAVLSALDRYRAGVPVSRIQAPPPGDPSLALTYPRTWMAFSVFGIGEEVTVEVSIACIVLCTLATLAFIGRLPMWQGLLYSMVLLSPSLMLGFERANADLVLYLMFLAACWCFARNRMAGLIAGNALLLLAALLKLYPIAACVASLKQRRGWAAFAVSVSLFALFVVADRDDLSRVRQNTPHDTYISFGARVLADQTARAFPSIAPGLLGAAAYLLVLLLLIAAVLFAWKSRPGLTLAPDLKGFAFLCGATMFLACFVIGNNYLYRFRLLILVMPQLLAWAAGGSRICRALLAAIAITVWTTSDGRLFLLSEALNWFLFWGLAFAWTVAELSRWSLIPVGERAHAIMTPDE